MKYSQIEIRFIAEDFYAEEGDPLPEGYGGIRVDLNDVEPFLQPLIVRLLYNLQNTLIERKKKIILIF